MTIMTTVEEAENLILAESKDFGTEIIPFELALGRVLAEGINADRDLPPFDRIITDGMINTISCGGKMKILVAKLPRVVIISSGDELVDIDTEPSPTQIRKSNSYTIHAVLSQYNVKADLLHIPDDPEITRQKIGY